MFNQKKNFRNLFVGVLAIIVMALPAFLFNTTSNTNVVEASIVESSSFAGTGTKANPYQISNAQQLQDFATNVNNGTNYYGEYVVLTSDINLQGIEWVPIGKTTSNCFKGHFNGQGHNIDNLTITTSTTAYKGLFGCVVSGGTGNTMAITNFSMTNVNIQCTVSSVSFAGAVLGFAELNHTKNSHNAYNYYTFDVTDIAVKSGKIKINSSMNKMNVVGGVVGGTSMSLDGKSINPDNYITDILNIWNCYSDSLTLEATNTGDINLSEKGGITGLAFAYIVNCYSLNNYLISPSMHFNQNANLLLIRHSYQTLNGIYYTYPYNTSGKSSDKLTAIYNLQTVYDNLINKNSDASVWIFDGSKIYLKSVGYINVVTSIDIPYKARYFDIMTSSWKDITGKSGTTKISLNQVVSQSAILGELTDEYNTTFLQALGFKYYSFEKSESTSVAIDTTSFTCEQSHINLADEGFTLMINFTNGYQFTLNDKTYWSVKNSTNIYVKNTNDNSFTVIDLTNPTNAKQNGFIPDAPSGQYFLGWSAVQVSKVCDFAGKMVDGKYIDWYTDGITFILKAERSGIQTGNFDITSLTGSIAGLNTNDANSTKTLYAVFGGTTIRAYTSVYKVIGGEYTKIDSYKITSNTASGGEGYLSINKNTNYDLSLKHSNDSDIAVSNFGYAVQWYVGVLDGTTITEYTTEYGVLTTPTSINTTLNNPTKETAVLVVLTPRTDIFLTVKHNEFVGGEKIITTVNDVIYTESIQTTFGETYTIKLSEIPEGFHIKNVKITSGEVLNGTLDKIAGTYIFTINSVDSITVEFVVGEGFFDSIFLYLVYGLLIGLGVIILSLIYSSIRRKSLQD